MALTDDVANRVEEVDGVTRVYCANHGDPRCGNGDEELGWAEPGWVMGVGWKKVGDSLCCSTYCAAITAGHDEEAAEGFRAEAFFDDPISEEAVAAMPSPAVGAELDLSGLEEFGGGE